MDKTKWQSHYPQGVPREINPDEFPNIHTMWEQAIKRFGDDPYLSCLGQTVTYREADLQAQWLASYLQNVCKIKQGDRLGLMLPNVIPHAIAMIAAQKIGVISVGINPLYTPREFIHQVNDADLDTIILLGQFAKTLMASKDQTSIKNVIVVGPCENLEMPSIPYPDALAQGKEHTLTPVEVKSGDIAVLQYTGGTTGISKGAMLTQRNIIASTLMCFNWLKDYYDTHPRAVGVGIFPFYHVAGLTGLMVGFKTSSLYHLIPNPRDIDHIVKVIAHEHPNGFSCVNTILNALLHHPQFLSLDFSHLYMTISGGMPTQKAVADKWKGITNVCITAGYGLSESATVISMTSHEAKDFRDSGIGYPVPSTEVMICDEQGKELPTGEIGEIWARGPQIMKGYWRRPRETEDVLTKDGWLKTGDMGRVDEEGFFELLDRKKDMLLVSGFNVYPAEIEDVLVHFPGVKEAAVIGVPDHHSGEAPKAFIVLSNPEVTAESILKYCHENLARYKVPKHIDFIAEIPKTSVGKILKRVLRDREKEVQVELKKAA